MKTQLGSQIQAFRAPQEGPAGASRPYQVQTGRAASEMRSTWAAPMFKFTFPMV